MNEIKQTHTPALWHVMNDCDVVDADGCFIAVDLDYSVDFEEAVANARLMAVAKRYETWEAHLVTSGDWDTPDGAPKLTQRLFDELMEIQSLRNAAIAKAKGETP